MSSHKLVKLKLPKYITWNMNYGPEWFIKNNIGEFSKDWKWNLINSKNEYNFIIIKYDPVIHNNIIKSLIDIYSDSPVNYISPRKNIR